MDPFGNLVSQARIFLGELAINNNREWFKAHKSRYEKELVIPAKLLLKHVAHDVGRDWGIDLKEKLFRPQRDVRFSKDKTPYHTHLHLLWSLQSRGQQNPGIFFGIAPDYVRMGGGLMTFGNPGLDNWRKSIDGPFGDEFCSVLRSVVEDGYHFEAPELKRVPAPYDKEHRHADLLRRKGLVIWHDLTETETDTPLATITNGADRMRPFLEALKNMP